MKRTIRISIIAFMTTIVLYTCYSIFASAEGYSFEYPSLGLIPVKYSYHDEMNKYFNDKIKAFLAMNPTDKNYSAPEQGKECSKNNVSSYCVAMGATDRYFAYVKTLDNISPTIANFNSSTVPIVGNPAATITDIFNGLASSDQKVNAEKKHALAVMDAAISAYNEFRLALPVHIKYDNLIIELRNYVDELTSLRRTLKSFPAKFVDTTSQSCK